MLQGLSNRKIFFWLQEVTCWLRTSTKKKMVLKIKFSHDRATTTCEDRKTPLTLSKGFACGWTKAFPPHIMARAHCKNVSESMLSVFVQQKYERLADKNLFTFTIIHVDFFFLLRRTRRHREWKANSQKRVAGRFTQQSLRVLQSGTVSVGTSSTRQSIGGGRFHGRMADAVQSPTGIVNGHPTTSVIFRWMADDAAALTQKRQLAAPAEFTDLSSAQSQVGEVAKAQQQLLANQQQSHRVNHQRDAGTQEGEQAQAER